MKPVKKSGLALSLLLSASSLATGSYAQNVNTPQDAQPRPSNATSVANPATTKAKPAPSGSSMPILAIGMGLGLVAILVGSGGSGGSGSKKGSNPAERTPTGPEIRERPFEILDGPGISRDRLVNIINSEKRADPNTISSIENSDYYKRNPAMMRANFANKFGLGLTGKGVEVGVYDTGIDWRNPSLKNTARGGSNWNFINPNWNINRHGTSVAMVLGGDAGDGHTRGIAPGVRIHDLAMLRERGDTEAEYRFERGQFGGAMDYIVSNKLDIVNMSIIIGAQDGEDLNAYAKKYFGYVFDQYVEAVDNGTIFVVAAGNSGNKPSVNGLAGVGIDPAMNNQLITVYSLRANGTDLSSYTNTCGAALMNFCIGAVGENLPITGMKGEDLRFNGTSAASPVVSGALALLREQHPELSSRELVELVLFTARDLGAPGVDPVYGRGALDMGRATAPVGELRVVSGATIDSDKLTGTSLRADIGRNMSSMATVLDGHTAVALDDFNRGFHVSAAALAQTDASVPDPISNAVLSFGSLDGRIVLSERDGGYYSTGHGLRIGYAIPEMVSDTGDFVMNRGYSPLGYLDRGIAATHKSGSVLIGGYYGMKGEDSAAAWLRRDMNVADGWLSFGAGAMRQDDKIISSNFGTGHGTTGWVTVSGGWDLGSNLSLVSEITAAKSRYKGEATFREIDAVSWSGRTGITHNDVLGGAATVSIGSPLTARSGSASIDLPGEREASDGSNATSGLERASVTGSFKNGFPIDVGVSYQRGIGGNGSASIGAVRRFNPDGSHENFAGATLNFRF